MPRVAPITGKSDVPTEHQAVVESVVNVFGGVRGPFSMLLHSPKLAERMLSLVTFFRARRNGLREDVIDLIRAKGDPGKLPAEERDIVAYTRQLMRTNRVDQSLFDALQKRFGTQWLVEMTAAVNYYALLCGVVNAFEVAAPPDGDKLPA
ncbi:MAG: hypothetical protein DME08_15935 [Candidatus Rokuibacteriota bacterium]|nr:MAG: hypothetical protein DME08_15935 [Candidatus Rokubacteria bacterium]